ncbi:hypothetical protein AX17_000750 [Amanita inopinata Kibby_2008]|nr:hypothetical protein AX17_000750 [Amanita inopinata Kibby_2008]
MLTPAQKLTKKQKKALAFRDRTKVNKTNQINALISQHKIEDHAVPTLESEGFYSRAGNAFEMGNMETSADAGRNDDEKAKTKSDNKVAGRLPRDMESLVSKASHSNKRKREEQGVALSVAGQGEKERKQKRKKNEALDSAGEGAQDMKVAVSQGKGKAKERFILFVGNLKYTTTSEALRGHFSSCDPPPVIRLLTPKAAANGKSTAKSKGCAFLEFSHRNALQQALQLHQSKLDGRLINVELTAGGGGRGEMRLKKLQERNKDLYLQREKRLEKKERVEGVQPTPRPDQFQRYSATSGIGQAPNEKRTWSVENVVDAKRRSKSRGRPRKNLGTGVNAIPVG